MTISSARTATRIGEVRSERGSSGRRRLAPRGLVLGAALLAALAAATPVRAQETERVGVDLDSLRVRLERLSREQMDEIRRIGESRREEMEALRETLRSESQRLAQAELELARTERELAAAQREQLEAMRARLLEEFNSLGDTVRALGFGEYAGFGPIAPLQGARFPSSRALSYYSLLPSTSMTSWMVGNRALAGAELTDLNPSLARYFDVGEGVLVTEVAEDSPAAEADLRPGDVIVRVDGGPVASIEEVRDAVGQAAFGAGFMIGAWQGATREPPEPITLSIVREGSPLELALPR